MSTDHSSGGMENKLSDTFWAVVPEDCAKEPFVRITSGGHPAEEGHAEECEGTIVYKLERLPLFALGEYLTSTGVSFDVAKVAKVITSRIKEVAATKINAVLPVHKQLNALRNGITPADQEAFEEVDSIRAWSNSLEQQLLVATTTEEVSDILMQLA